MAPTTTPPLPPTAGNRRLYTIALHQRRLIMCVLISILIYVGFFAISSAIGAGANAAGVESEGETAAALGLGVLALLGVVIISLLTIAIITVISIFKLGEALWNSPGLGALCAVLMFAPCISLVVMVVVIGRATGQLKAAGIPVGILGVSPAARARLA